MARYRRDSKKSSRRKKIRRVSSTARLSRKAYPCPKIFEIPQSHEGTEITARHGRNQTKQTTETLRARRKAALEEVVAGRGEKFFENRLSPCTQCLGGDRLSRLRATRIFAS